MSSLSDRLEVSNIQGQARYKVPDDYKPFQNWDGSVGEVQSSPHYAPIDDDDRLLESEGLNPKVYELVGEVRRSKWQNGAVMVDRQTGLPLYDDDDQPRMRELWSYRFRYRKRMEALDLPALFAAAKKAARSTRKPYTGLHGDVHAIVVWADPQTGKVASRGDSGTLLTRVEQKQELLTAWLKKHRPDTSLFADVGDGVEGFENVAAQMFTNDLSLPDQIDLEATMEFNTIQRMTAFGPVVVAKTTSNHGAWRAGKNVLGKAGDDWGIHIGKRLKFSTELAKMDVTYNFPRPDDHSMALEYGGHIIGLQHGHMVNRPEGIPDWWARQTHGGQPVGGADILITGHFHHLRVQPTGRNPYSGRSKWWLQAPTLDNGSDWYRNLRGDDSDPGLMVFLVDANGFNLSSLTIL